MVKIKFPKQRKSQGWMDLPLNYSLHFHPLSSPFLSYFSLPFLSFISLTFSLLCFFYMWNDILFTVYCSSLFLVLTVTVSSEMLFCSMQNFIKTCTHVSGLNLVSLFLWLWILFIFQSSCVWFINAKDFYADFLFSNITFSKHFYLVILSTA